MSTLLLPTVLLRGLLRVLPAPVLRALDAWSQRQAQRRAARRRRAVRQARHGLR